MQPILDYLFSDGGYTPHGFCIAWDWRVLWTHIGSDLLIAASYFAIPGIMLVFLRRRKDPRLYQPAMLFVVFITACGVSHLISILTLFYPWYGLQGVIKLFTGVVSFITALALWKLLPDALKIPSPDALMAALAEKEDEIRERAAAQEELETHKRLLDQQVEALEAANQELREFAYAASHDLKAPANTLSLLVKDLQEDEEDQLSDHQRDCLCEADKILGRMRTLVDDILQYSRTIDSGERPREQVDLTQAFVNAMSDMQADILKARAEIEIEPLPQISGFPALISVMANNLLSNALKFRSPDHPLRIRVFVTQSLGDTPGVTLHVQDNGLGIDPEHHERIFKLFKRLHRAEDYAGTGLGLALCRRVALTHGGMIEVSSSEGVGATFSIFFPTEVADVRHAA
ncbi:histidine kinase/DNA gyrase B/HSP90-like ATPase [Litoreibacter ponti]|uniref:histidine kinase n=1 Tax=Litoreibacter ponti TaxID=1510457 RepID=A0A2T6BE16_9RHOB|nr:ATP-binding protein [Litoreibacter ponti]PTX54307.1 histidine kinase/DNA gyrase B/HSP90-like ATPase [Litoreibacter ponti]